MWPRSARFDAAVVQPHRVAIHAALWSPGMTELLADDLEVDGGSVTASRTSTHRRSCTADLVDRDGTLARLFADDRTVQPYELVVSRGITYPGGSSELLPLGVFPVSGVKVPLFPAVRYSLTTYDRSRRVARNRFTSVYVIQAGTSYVAAAVALVADRLPFPVDVVTMTASTATTPSPIAYLEQDDPWAKVQELVAAAGCETYFDQIGRHVIRDVPTGLGSPEFSYAVGENGILLPETERSISDDPGYNAVLAIGESSSNDASIPRYLAYDSDPASPTYFFGRYGKVPEIYSSATVTDPDRAQLVAVTRLRQRLGRNVSMNLAIVPHPAHDPGDVVRVDTGDVERLMVVDTATVPLDVETAGGLACRSQAVEVA